VTSVPEASTPKPTATQVDAPGQATPPNWLKPGPLRVLCRLHVVPSQRSATVEAVPELSLLEATAVQADDDEHATLPRIANCDPVGFGVDCTVHLWLFHRSASVIPEAEVPAAKQAEAELHETAKSGAP
jgi:hypothetical protein